MRVRPAADAISTTAVRPESMSPYRAWTGSPSGPSTCAVRFSPCLAETSASTVPSPPSATGTSMISALGRTARTPRAMAAAACVAVSVPLKAFGATSTFTRPRLVDRDRPVLVLRRLAAHGAEVDVLELLRELAHLAVAHGPAVDLHDRRDLRAGSTQEQLVAGVELGAVDASLEHRQVELFPHAPHREFPRHALEDVVGHGRGDERAVLEHEEVLRGAFGNMTVDGHHDRLVEAVFDGLRLRQRRLRVGACDLRPRRQRLVWDAPPAAHHAPDAPFDLDVLAEGDGVDEEVAVEVVQADADLFARCVEQGPNIDIGLELVASQELERVVDQLLGRVRKLHAHDVRGPVHPVVVRGRREQVELAFLRVPVGADALEDGGAVVERMRHQAELDVVIAGKIVVEEDPRVGMDRRLLHRG